MNRPLNSDELETVDNGDLYLNGLPFSGVLYERNHETGFVVCVFGASLGKLHGSFRSWYSSGQMKSEAFYRDGVLHGPVRQWFDCGRIEVDEYYEAGVPTRSTEWNEDGTVKNVFISDSVPEEERIIPVWSDPETIADIDLDSWEFVEHPNGWGRDPVELPQPVSRPQLPNVA